MSDQKKRDDETLRSMAGAGFGDVKQADRTLDERTARTGVDAFNTIDRAAAATAREVGDLSGELKGKREIANERDHFQKMFPGTTIDRRGRTTKR